jgi:hypothetical protein
MPVQDTLALHVTSRKDLYVVDAGGPGAKIEDVLASLARVFPDARAPSGIPIASWAGQTASWPMPPGANRKYTYRLTYRDPRRPHACMVSSQWLAEDSSVPALVVSAADLVNEIGPASFNDG